MNDETRSLDTPEVEGLIRQLGERLQADLLRHGVSDPLMVGIHTGGVWVADLLHRQLGLSEPLGVLDISFYRDDFTRIGMNPEVRPSDIPFDLEGRHVLLVDDVIQTGRTARAALNELFDYGRPASVSLLVLVQRNGRELPIQPKLSALQLDQDAQVTLAGPAPLRLFIGHPKQVARAAGEAA
ncbi:MAG: bifunctional pyr operon transcriptional regulator/uracil phosphoribosyltransferase PyrR [Gammaproteobacteria bacterium SHHR-1]|uniref:bifunctional pyr operon transcriptional regulator/uracil phosphoribosyltransferase PyrR n=1 Tax=Magnetovirga frankeli TaxID=947516 RepID=UPI0012937910|nr:bifunctional pyr operon transcriptional regulator/uracil phosphoribosyltransferase PyrR [gamma proteobacterium SS-5]